MDSPLKEALLHYCENMQTSVKNQVENRCCVDDGQMSAQKVAPDATADVAKSAGSSPFIAFFHLMYAHPAADNNDSKSCMPGPLRHRMAEKSKGSRRFSARAVTFAAAAIAA